MKLNKVMALALSGLMAVSMLAGCSNGTPNGEENGEQGQVVANDIVSVLNDSQDTVKFSANTPLENALKATGEKLKSSDIKNYTNNYNPNVVGSGTVAEAYQKVAPVGYETLQSVSNALFTSSVPTKEGQTTKNVLYVMNAKSMDLNSAVAMISNNLATSNYADMVLSGSTEYNATYVGSAAATTVTKTDESGDTYSVYLVAISITQNVTKADSTVK